MCRPSLYLSFCCSSLRVVVVVVVVVFAIATPTLAISTCLEPYLQVPASQWLRSPPLAPDDPSLFSVTLEAWRVDATDDARYTRTMTSFVRNTGNVTASVDVSLYCTIANELQSSVSIEAQPNRFLCDIRAGDFCLVTTNILATAAPIDHAVGWCSIVASIQDLQPCYSSVGKHANHTTAVPLIFDPCLNAYPEPFVALPREQWLNHTVPPSNAFQLTLGEWTIDDTATRTNATMSVSCTITNAGDGFGSFSIAIQPPTSTSSGTLLALSHTGNFTCALDAQQSCSLHVLLTCSLTSSPTQSDSGFGIDVCISRPTNTSQCWSTLGKQLSYRGPTIQLPLDPCALEPPEPSLLQPVSDWKQGAVPRIDDTTFTWQQSAVGWQAYSQDATADRLFVTDIAITIYNAGQGAADVAIDFVCSAIHHVLAAPRDQVAHVVQIPSNSSVCHAAAASTCSATVSLLAPSTDDPEVRSNCSIVARVINTARHGCWSDLGKSVTLSHTLLPLYDRCTAYRTEPYLQWPRQAWLQQAPPSVLLLSLDATWTVVPATETAAADFVLNANTTLLLRDAAAQLQIAIQCDNALVISHVLQPSQSSTPEARTPLIAANSLLPISWQLHTNTSSTQHLQCQLLIAIVRSDAGCWSAVGKSIVQSFGAPAPDAQSAQCSSTLVQEPFLQASSQTWPDASPNPLAITLSSWQLVRDIRNANATTQEATAAINVTMVALNRGNGSSVVSSSIECSSDQVVSTTTIVASSSATSPPSSSSSSCYLAAKGSCTMAMTLYMTPAPELHYVNISCIVRVSLGAHVCWSDVDKQMTQSLALQSPSTTCLRQHHDRQYEAFLFVDRSVWEADPDALAHSADDPLRLQTTNWFSVGYRDNRTVWELMISTAAIHNTGISAAVLLGSVALTLPSNVSGDPRMEYAPLRSQASCLVPANSSCHLSFVVQCIGDTPDTAAEALMSLTLTLVGDQTSCWSDLGKSYTANATVAYPAQEQCIGSSSSLHEPTLLIHSDTNALSIRHPRIWTDTLIANDSLTANSSTTTTATTTTATTTMSKFLPLTAVIRNAGNYSATATYHLDCRLPAFANANTSLSTQDLTDSPWYCVLGAWPAVCNLALHIVYQYPVAPPSLNANANATLPPPPASATPPSPFFGDAVCALSVQIVSKPCWSNVGKAIIQRFELPDPDATLSSSSSAVIDSYYDAYDSSSPSSSAMASNIDQTADANGNVDTGATLVATIILAAIGSLGCVFCASTIVWGMRNNQRVKRAFRHLGRTDDERVIYQQLQRPSASDTSSASVLATTPTTVDGTGASESEILIEMEEMPSTTAAAAACMCGAEPIVHCQGCQMYYCRDERCWNWSHSGLHPSLFARHNATILEAQPVIDIEEAQEV
jgi:hypothetical protein